MTWNWQYPDWPNFSWEANQLARAESLFLQQCGIVIGARTHLSGEEDSLLTIQLMSDEASDTSQIEGELLDRNSIQASIRSHLGLHPDRRSGPAEQSIARMMVNLYQHLDTPLTEDVLFAWHEMLMNGRWDLRSVGYYRRHDDPMEIVSGPLGRRRVHFIAPPSNVIPHEMERFLNWFSDTAPDGSDPLPAITRAGIAHLWFESLHPFEDGNGRLGRALIEKALAQSIGRPVLTGVSGALLRHRKTYYASLNAANSTLAITPWLNWFAEVTLEAQQRSLIQITFVIQKKRLLDRTSEALNPRQRKVVLRMLEEGPGGFKDGLSAGKYMKIADATPASATRDLGELVTLGVLERTGERKATRYHLNLEVPEV